jgi:hypothetical protein
MSKQSQKGGDKSTNVQGENITIISGVSYAEVETIALNVFKANFMELSGDAAELAIKRAEDITRQFLEKLKTENEEGIANAKDPDFQHALFSVQKNYARTGDKELGDLLVDLLVDRTKHSERSLIQIVLKESLSTAPKLTSDQLAVLSIIHHFKETVISNIVDIKAFTGILDRFVEPFSGSITKSQTCYKHLDFTGCVSTSIGSTSIEALLQKRYGGLFSRGFTEEELQRRDITTSKYSALLIKCLHDSDKMQFFGLSRPILLDNLSHHGVQEQEAQKLTNLYDSTLMGYAEIKELLLNLCPYMENVFDVWHGSSMKNVNLTSVGIAIAHANTKKQCGEFGNLSSWMN